MFCRDAEGFAVSFGDFEGDGGILVAVEKVSETFGFDNVTWSDTRVIRLVREPQGQNTLFL